MNDPLSEAREALRTEQQALMQRHIAGDDISGAAALRIHNVLARLDARPACVRTPDFITEAGFGSGWYYPDSPSEGGTK